MNLRASRVTAAVAVTLLAGGLVTACNRGSTTSGSAAAASKPAIGIDLPRADSAFWNSYAQYIKSDARSQGLNTLPISNSQNDLTRLVANVQVFEQTGAKAVIMAPQDTGGI